MVILRSRDAKCHQIASVSAANQPAPNVRHSLETSYVGHNYCSMQIVAEAVCWNAKISLERRKKAKSAAEET